MDIFLSWASSAYSAPAILASISTILIAYAFWTFAEYLAPAEKGQGLDRKLFNLIATFAFVLGTPVALYVGGSVIAFIVGGATEPLFKLDLRGWYTNSSSSFQAFVLVPFLLIPTLIFDFFYYWFHRAQHSWSWLWEVHKLHHTDAAVNVTTSYRHHWTEEFFRSIWVVLPMSFLFDISPAEGGFLSVFFAQWGHFVHANIRLPLGLLGLFIAGPQYHRIHHSIEPGHWNKNFAAFFPLWDFVFGTAHIPKASEWPRTGVDGENSMPNLLVVLFGPFAAWMRTAPTAFGRKMRR